MSMELRWEEPLNTIKESWIVENTKYKHFLWLLRTFISPCHENRQQEEKKIWVKDLIQMLNIEDPLYFKIYGKESL